MKQILYILSVLSLFLLNSSTLSAYDSAIDHLLEGTIICSGTEAKAQAAFDGDASTYYSTNSNAFGWVGLDLGEPHVITRIGFTPASGWQGADRMFLSLFEGANSPDFMDAIPLYFIGERPATGADAVADVNVSRGFRYVRYVGGTGSYCNIAELSFYGHAGVGDDSRFYQITNLPTLSIHVKDNILPTVRGEDFTSNSVLIYEDGTMLQEYPIQFRVRGNFSSTHENKAFRMKYDDGKSHHVMRGGKNESPAKCKKWVLINSYRDKTLMRNPVAWAMSKRGELQWTPWSQVVDLIVNGDYRGTYTLADAVTIDKNRIRITEMTETDTEGEALTGGYYIEADNNYSRETYHFMSSHGNTMSVHEPDEDIMQPAQFQYIQNTWNNMEGIVFGKNYTDPEAGLRSVVDVESFLRWFLISEFNGNTDMICQVFLYKERGDDHFYTGPVWDADLALENDITTYPANERMDWTYKVRQTGQYSQLVSRILSDPSVFAQLQEIWAKLRKKGAFNPEDVAADVDSLRREIRASANLNFTRWPYLNQELSLNPQVPGSWELEVDRVRDYVYNRVAWMDEMLSYGTLRKENGIYQIASGFDLCTFSQLVNEGGQNDAQAELVADIDMADYNADFKPIGTSAAPFNGTFNGNGHTIRNLHLTGGDAVALFPYCGNCTFQNIVFDETCRVEGNGGVAMLCGNARNGAVTISGVENHGTVIASGNAAAALVGSGRLLSVVSITNSSNTGSITAQSNAAALVGTSAGKLTMENCYNAGSITGASEGKEFGFATKSLVINNCWDYTSTQTLNMTPAQVDNGELCYLINSNAGKDIWRQNLDNGREHDLWPVLRKTAGMVYKKDGIYTNIISNLVPYRYFKLTFTQLQGGQSGVLQFAEFDLLNEVLEEMGNFSAYNGPEGFGGEGWGNAADDNVGTKYCGSFSGNSSFLFDAGSEVNVYGYRIYTANDTQSNPGRNPSSWKLYGSNSQLDVSDSGWQLIDERKDDWTMQATNYEPYDFYIPMSLKTLVLNKQRAMLLPGEELQLEYSYTPLTIQNLSPKWVTSNADVATVDENGRVVATGLGKADIILSVPNISTLRDTCSVVVVKERPGHRYYQLAIDAIRGGSGTIQLSEFDLLDAEGKEVTPLTLYAYTGSSVDNHPHSDLIDDSYNTKYCGSYSAGTTLYIYIDAGKKVTLSGYRLTTANDTQKYPARNPASWSLLGSNVKSKVPGSDVWTLLDRRENDNTLAAVNYTPYDFFFTYPTPVIPGDVNGDGLTDLLDYEAMRNYIVGRQVEGFNVAAADINADGKVNAQDLMRLINILTEE